MTRFDALFEEARVYSSGLVCCSVCVPIDMPIGEVERLVNLHHSTGIDSRWALSSDEHFAGGEPNPSPCADDRARQHFLLAC